MYIRSRLAGKAVDPGLEGLEFHLRAALLSGVFHGMYFAAVYRLAADELPFCIGIRLTELNREEQKNVRRSENFRAADVWREGNYYRDRDMAVGRNWGRTRQSRSKSMVL